MRKRLAYMSVAEAVALGSHQLPRRRDDAGRWAPSRAGRPDAAGAGVERATELLEAEGGGGLTVPRTRASCGSLEFTPEYSGNPNCNRSFTADTNHPRKDGRS
jgi:hypothetical protein